MKVRNLFKIGLFFLSMVVFSTCAKEEVTPTFNLRFTNISNNPYLVEIDGTSLVLPGNKFRDYELELGTYAWKATQQSGYILFPTVRSGTITLDKDLQIIFP